MKSSILTLNAGSSSLKFSIFARDDLALLASGSVNRIGADTELKAGLAGEEPTRTSLARGSDHAAAFGALLDWVDRNDYGWRIEAVAHRIVHGGTKHVRPTVVTQEVLQELALLVPLAPLHQPHNLAGIAASRAHLGEIPDIACFDTAFHAGRDPLHTRFALPAEWDERGFRRYGFHGLSYQWLSLVLARDHPDLHAGRVVAAHLGNGSSLCAMRAGRSIDTTMSMTAVDGVPMGTRTGAMDPGAILLMQRNLGMSVADVENLIYNRAGLLGLSGKSNDVATLLADGSPESRFALDYFALRCAQAAASLAISLGGIDGMVFTGGIGENAGSIRDAILSHLAPLAPFRVLVIPANEERMMAMEALELIG